MIGSLRPTLLVACFHPPTPLGAKLPTYLRCHACSTHAHMATKQACAAAPHQLGTYIYVGRYYHCVTTLRRRIVVTSPQCVTSSSSRSTDKNTLELERCQKSQGGTTVQTTHMPARPARAPPARPRLRHRTFPHARTPPAKRALCIPSGSGHTAFLPHDESWRCAVRHRPGRRRSKRPSLHLCVRRAQPAKGLCLWGRGGPAGEAPYLSDCHLGLTWATPTAA